MGENAIIAKLRDLIEKADTTFIQVGKHTKALSAPDLPIKRGVTFVKDRISELILDEPGS